MSAFKNRAITTFSQKRLHWFSCYLSRIVFGLWLLGSLFFVVELLLLLFFVFFIIYFLRGGGGGGPYWKTSHLGGGGEGREVVGKNKTKKTTANKGSEFSCDPESKHFVA